MYVHRFCVHSSGREIFGWWLVVESGCNRNNPELPITIRFYFTGSDIVKGKNGKTHPSVNIIMPTCVYIIYITPCLIFHFSIILFLTFKGFFCFLFDVLYYTGRVIKSFSLYQHPPMPMFDVTIHTLTTSRTKDR